MGFGRFGIDFGARTRPETEAGQTVGNPVGVPVEIGVSELLVAEEQTNLVSLFFGSGLEHL